MSQGPQPTAAAPDVLAMREALQEILNLCAIGDVNEDTEAYGWGDAIKRANAALSAQGEAPAVANLGDIAYEHTRQHPYPSDPQEAFRHGALWAQALLSGAQGEAKTEPRAGEAPGDPGLHLYKLRAASPIATPEPQEGCSTPLMAACRELLAAFDGPQGQQRAASLELAVASIRDAVESTQDGERDHG